MAIVPDELVAFLSVPANRQLRFGAGGEIEALTLFAPDELVESVFSFRGASSISRAVPSFEIAGIDLVKQCPHYSPRGILVWFPSQSAFGAWDDDHKKIMVFTGVHWSTIARDPSLYFNGQWYPDGVAHRYLSAKDVSTTSRSKRQDGPLNNQPL